jgi:hypothetical protein
MKINKNMELAIKTILDKGTLDKERVILTAEIDLPIGNFVVFGTAFSTELNTVLGGSLKWSYWFPDGQVKAKDLVVLYSKAGKNNVRENPDGTRTHFYYWFKKEPVWGVPGAALVVANILDWDFKRLDDSTADEKTSALDRPDNLSS